MDIKFNSVEELYKRITPALRTKKKELKRLGYTYINEEDIWNYFKDNKWTSSKGLSLSEMVDDILNGDNKKIDSYVKLNLNKKREDKYED